MRVCVGGDSRERQSNKTHRIEEERDMEGGENNKGVNDLHRMCVHRHIYVLWSNRGIERGRERGRGTGPMSMCWVWEGERERETERETYPL